MNSDSFSSFKKNKFQNYLKDPRKLIDLFSRNKKEIITWVGFAFLAYCIYIFFASGDFSFIFTLSSLVQMFGLVLLVFKIYSTKSVSGLSKNSIICYVILFFPKVLTLTFYEGYLPYDSSGDVIYRIAEWISFICSAATLYFF